MTCPCTGCLFCSRLSEPLREPLLSSRDIANSPLPHHNGTKGLNMKEKQTDLFLTTTSLPACREEQKDMITILFNNSITIWNGQIHKAKQGREKITSMAALGKYSHMKFSSLLGEVRKKPHGLGRN